MTGPVAPFRIHRLTVTESTNDVAGKAAEAGEAEGLVVWALRQTAGRGRHGRIWESPEGNLHFSVLLRPGGDARDAAPYGFAASLAVSDVVQGLLPHVSVTLKWPNDVLAGGKKIAGILLEAGAGWLVAGVGLNVAHHPAEGLYPATSLHALGIAPPGLPAILDRLLARFRHWCDILRRQGFAPVRAAWLERAQKGLLSVRLPQGTVEGDFAGLGEDGRLCLRLADGSEQAIATGDVFCS